MHETSEKLIEENALLKKRIQKLERLVAERQQLEESLRERMKELNCVYALAKIIEGSDTLEEIFRKTVNVMPNSWLYPEIACARITYGDQEFKTENFQETPWKIAADVIVKSQPLGLLEVRYLKEMPAIHEGPFFQEERNLINSVAERLGRVVERKLAEVETNQYKMRMESLLRIARYRAETIEDFLDFALEESISLTGSKLGYIYYYNDEKREFTLNTWSKDVMKECTIQERKVLYDLDKTGAWGEAVRQAKPIIINDFLAPNPLKKGYPEGHAHLYRFLTLPIFSDGQIVAVLGVANKDKGYNEVDISQLTILMGSVWQIAERKRVAQAREKLLADLQDALLKIKTLNGLIPICASCKKIRDDKGYWNQVEKYISEHTEAQFSHGICPECVKKLYPELSEEK